MFCFDSLLLANCLRNLLGVESLHWNDCPSRWWIFFVMFEAILLTLKVIIILLLWMHYTKGCKALPAAAISSFPPFLLSQTFACLGERTLKWKELLQRGEPLIWVLYAAQFCDFTDWKIVHSFQRSLLRAATRPLCRYLGYPKNMILSLIYIQGSPNEVIAYCCLRTLQRHSTSSACQKMFGGKEAWSDVLPGCSFYNPHPSACHFQLHQWHSLKVQTVTCIQRALCTCIHFLQARSPLINYGKHFEADISWYRH